MVPGATKGITEIDDWKDAIAALINGDFVGIQTKVDRGGREGSVKETPGSIDIMQQVVTVRGRSQAVRLRNSLSSTE